MQVAGRPILHRGKRLVDAAVFEAVPFRAAIADGCTHIITLCSRPPLQCVPRPSQNSILALRPDLAGVQAAVLEIRIRKSLHTNQSVWSSTSLGTIS